jgi:hypothetical protein
MSMILPTPVLSWLFLNNQRETYASVNDATAFAFYTAWNFLIGTAALTCKYTCDGTTGPTSTSDHTNRLVSKTTCSHRGVSTTSACSFGVATDGAGADWLFAYVGAGTSPTGDDLFYIAVSPTGAYVPAGTASNVPTATDQIVVLNSATLVGTGANDRLVSMQASTDKKNFRLWVYSAATLQREVFFERCSSTVVSALGWNDPLVVGNAAAVAAGSANTTAGGCLAAPAAGTQGSSGNAYAKIGGTVANVGGGGEVYLNVGNSGAFGIANPEANGASPLVPTVFASNTAGARGKLGNRVDSWFAYLNGIVDGTPFGTGPFFQFMQVNSRFVPWDSTNPLVTQ